MKQFPNNIIYKKCHKANYSYIKLLDRKNFFLSYGQFGLQSLNFGKLTFKQIEACRRTIKRGLKKLGFLFIRVFTGTPITKKPTATRMGKGKGSIDHWVSIIKKGQIIFEINGINLLQAKNIFEKCSHQLPLKTKIVKIFY
jgi:large subunit ribosomal protein L16